MGKSILGIAGSLRRGSYNRRLLAAAVEGAPAGVAAGASTECLLLPRPALFVREAGALFDEAGRLTDPPTREQLDAVLVAFTAPSGSIRS